MSRDKTPWLGSGPPVKLTDLFLIILIIGLVGAADAWRKLTGEWPTWLDRLIAWLDAE